MRNLVLSRYLSAQWASARDWRPTLYHKVFGVSLVMRAEQINRATSIALTVVSLTALLPVLSGYLHPPLPDEGAAAHIFQLSIVALVPMIFLFLATADWTQPLRSMRRLAFPAAALVLAFAALYYLEHCYYPAHYR